MYTEIEIIFSMPALTLTCCMTLRNLCAQLSFQTHDMGDNTKFLGVLEQANAIRYMKEL